MAKRAAVNKRKQAGKVDKSLQTRFIAARKGRPFKGRRFSDWLPLDRVGAWPARSGDYVDFILDRDLRVPPSLKATPTEGAWQLAPDWRFDEILRKAESSPEHRWFPGRDVSSGPAILTEQLHALEQALNDLHPGITREALEDFWFSANVGDFVRGLECRLRSDRSAKTSARIEWESLEENDRKDGFGPFFGDLVVNSKLFVWHQITQYFNHIDNQQEVEHQSDGNRLIPKEVWADLRKNLRPARTKYGHTQAEISVLLCKDQSTIGRWERGLNTPPLNMQASIEHYIEKGTEFPSR